MLEKHRNLKLATAILLSAVVADATLGGTSTLAVSTSTRRVSAIVDTTSSLVTAPVVEQKIEATQTWAPATSDTVVTEVTKVAEEPFRPYLPLALALISVDCDGNGVPDSTQISAGAMDWDGDGVLDSCEYAMGDLNLNGFIDGQDVSILLGWWGISNPLYGDLNGDGIVNAIDLGTILGRYGVVTY